MKFTPKSDEELRTKWEPGQYAFEVIEAKDAFSKAGDAQIEITVLVYKGEDKHLKLRDWLAPEGTFAFKLKHFAKAVGLLDHYEKGDLDPMMMIGKSGTCKLGVNKKSGYNQIQDYLVPDAKEEQKQPTNPVEGEPLPWDK